MTKIQLRRECLNRRKNLTDRKKREGIIFSKASALVLKENVSCVGIYVSYREEVDTFSLISFCLNQNIKVCVPKMKEEGKMDFIRISSLEDLKPEPQYGIPEPMEGEIVSPKEIELMFVPGSVFDRDGNRLGYGKGYYDRYLVETECKKIGICFSVQLVDSLRPFLNPTDIAMDRVISDEN